MSITIEACNDGTITRACARAINRALGTAYSGTTLIEAVMDDCDRAGVAYAYVAATALAGATKAAHAREIARSRKAQARRTARKAAEAAA